MIGVFVAVLCLAAGSYSAPLACEKLVHPLDHLDLQALYGKWDLIAVSMKSPIATEAFKGRDSMAVHFSNSSYIHIFRVGDSCEYHPSNISMSISHFNMSLTAFNFTGAFLHTSCPDCQVLRLETQTRHYTSLDLMLFSKRRELEQTEMEEFKAQVDCLNLPPYRLMDPTKERCPEKAEVEATEENH